MKSGLLELLCHVRKLGIRKISQFFKLSGYRWILQIAILFPKQHCPIFNCIMPQILITEIGRILLLDRIFILLSSTKTGGMDESEKSIKPQVQEESGWEFLARIRKRPLIEGLDSRLFANGPHAQESVEITGKLSSGKTLLLMQLVAKCLLPPVYDGIQIEGLDVAVLLINTDHHFRVSKLVHLMHCIVAKACRSQEILCSGSAIRELLIVPCLKNLTVVNCYDNSQFKVTLATLDDILMNNPQIGLLAIDSISSFYWQERDIGGVWLINQYLKNVLKILQKNIFRYNIVLIYTRPDNFGSKVNDTIALAEQATIEKINYRIDLANGSCGAIGNAKENANVRFKVCSNGIKWISES